MPKLLGIIIGILLLIGNLEAQTPFCKPIGVENGLPSNNVYCAFQDDEGLIWIGTDNGVSRYNGYEFEHFSLKEGLTDIDILAFVPDSKGRLWCRTGNGIPCFFKDGKIYNGDNYAPLAGVRLLSYITVIFEDPDGNIIMGSFKGSIYKITDSGSQLIAQGLQHNIKGFMAGKDGHLFYIDPFGFHSLDPFEPFITLDQADTLLEDLKVYPDYGKKYMTFNGKVVHLLDVNKVKEIFRLPPGPASAPGFLGKSTISVYQRENGEFLIGTYDGFFVVQDGDPENYQHYFAGLTVTWIMEDREGILWICTREKGIFCSQEPHIMMQAPFTYDAHTHCLKLFNEDDKNLWVAGIRGNYAIKKGDRLESYKLKNDIGEVVSFRQDFQGRIWVVGKSGTMIHDGDKKIWIFNWANDHLMLPNGDHLLGTHQIVKLKTSDLLDFAKTSQKKAYQINADSVILENKTIAFAKGKDEQIWAGTEIGLVLLEHYKPLNMSHLAPGLDTKVRALKYIPEHDLLLVGTLGKGLFIIKNGSEAIIVGAEEGLEDLNITAIEYLGDGEALVGTGRSYFRTNVLASAPRAINEGVKFGLENVKVNDLTVFQGSLYLATDEGLIFFPMDLQEEPIVPPLIFLQDVKVNGRLTTDSIMEFRYNQNSISINFLGLSFRNRKIDHYEYRLSGYDSDWLKTTSREVNYQALAPGHYHFEVKAIGGHGVESDGMASYSFTILKPFWQEAWFVYSIVLFCCVVLAIGLKLRISFVRNRYELIQAALKAERDKVEVERNLLELEQQALRMQMNPHFIFNALNTIKGYYAEAKTMEASGYIAKFARLLRHIIESKDQLIPLEKEIAMLNLYLELIQIRYDQKFDFRIDCGPEVSQAETGIPPMLLQPLVENAIIHGLGPKKEKGMLEVGIRKEDDMLLCWVQDNGIGREAASSRENAKNGLSKATKIVKDRLALLSKRTEKPCTISYFDLKSPDGSSTGTRAEVKIPYESIW